MVVDQCNSRQCTQFILPTFDNWREWLILLQSTRMVDSDICIDKIGWFYPNRESTFWTMHAILELHIPILAMRNNKMGHRINKMWTLINKVGHRNVKLVDTYQQVWFKKQQNGSRVLYRWWSPVMLCVVCYSESIFPPTFGTQQMEEPPGCIWSSIMIQ